MVVFGKIKVDRDCECAKASASLVKAGLSVQQIPSAALLLFLFGSGSSMKPGIVLVLAQALGLLVSLTAAQDPNAPILTAFIRDFRKTDTALGFGLNVATNSDDGQSIVSSPLADTAIRKPTLRTGVTASINSATFDTWWADAPDSTYQVSYSMVFSTRGQTDFWVFDRSNFYPIDNRGYGNEGDANNNYFTMSFSTQFLAVRAMALTFASADDMWIFVNGVLQTDALAGIHARRQTTITLPEALYPVGQLIRLDVYYAHRSSQRAPSIRIEVVTPARCNAFLAPNRVPASLFNTANYALNGAAAILNTNSLRLLNSADVDATGSAVWYKQLIPIPNGFVADFTFTITPRTAGVAEGFAFVCQAVDTISRGFEGGNLAYNNIPNSFAVEFDTLINAALDAGVLGSHISVHMVQNGAGPNSAAESSSVARTANNALSTLNLLDGTPYNARIVVAAADKDRTNFYMDVFISDMRASRLTFTFPAASFLTSFSNERVYCGFTASSSGSSAATVLISNFRLWNVGTSGPRATALNVPSSIPAASVPVASGTFSVQQRDACNRNVFAGGSSASANLLSNGVSVKTVAVVDLGTGLYSVRVAHTVAGVYTLSVLLDGQAINSEVPLITTITPLAVFPERSQFVVSDSGTLTAGTEYVLTITARDQFDNLNTAPIDASAWAVRLSSPETFLGNASSQVVGTATYRVAYRSNIAGTWQFFVQSQGRDLLGSPRPGSVTVIAGSPSPNLPSTATGVTIVMHSRCT